MSRKTKKQTLRTIAVFADCQNVGVIKYDRAILRFLKQWGEAPILWAYHDWKKVANAKQRKFQTSGWQCLNITAEAKNDLDNHLMTDCRRLFRYWLPDIAVLISCDRDFVPLVQEILAQGSQVMIIGRQNHVSRQLKSLVPQHIYFVENL